MVEPVPEPSPDSRQSPLARYEELFYDLHTGVAGDHERPHKPTMLLAVMDLIAEGVLTENLIPFSPALRERFRRYFDVVRSANDQNTPENPFFYLRSEGFWGHQATPGNEALVKELSSAPPVGRIPQVIAGAVLEDALFALLRNASHRSQLRDVLISRYFPSHREALAALAPAPPSVQETAPEFEETAQARSRGFSRIVVVVYEHQCAACGLRLRLPNGATIVDAAHLIPFSVSYDDPRNGMALCKNHHWAMDSRLIAPGPDHHWHATRHLDDRQEGQRHLLQLAGRPLILPKESAYHPRPDALEWRLKALLT
ncbi:MAG: HNH endonuclease [Verrucomicrobiales bacterium]